MDDLFDQLTADSFMRTRIPAKGGWDHEHCSRCGAKIMPLTLSWVTKSGRYLLLDDKCHVELVGVGP